MPPNRRVASTCLALGALLLAAGCASGSADSEPGTSSPASTPAGSSTSSGSTSSGSSPTATPTEIVVSVKDGKVTPKTHRVKIALGSPVHIMVTSDVDDEVHVHGYEIEKEASAGQPVTIEFTADQAGVFEVETHESDLQLLQLQVQ